MGARSQGNTASGRTRRSTCPRCSPPTTSTSCSYCAAPSTRTRSATRARSSLPPACAANGPARSAYPRSRRPASRRTSRGPCMDTRTKNVSLEDLQKIVGEDHAREATPEDAIDGVQPSFVAAPGSVEETSELLKFAADEGLAISPRGGGTKVSLGNPPRELDLVLSTARMDDIIEHVPGDQVVRVQAGIRLQDLQEQLSGSDQMLAIDPPERRATIGGIIAANASGPRRYRYGTIRDLIIGITVVLHDG